MKKVYKKHTFEKPKISDINEIVNEKFHILNKGFDLFVKHDSILVVDKEFYSPIKSELQINQTKFPVKKVLLL